MKRIISTMAMVCLSFSCFAEDYFVKVADNEYVLQHGEKAENLRSNNSAFGTVASVDAVYTPTHIFTYPDGNPAHFRNIQKINYTESNVTFYKDIKSRKCCIDIYDDEKNPNKCRIIGVNGHNIESFEVYEVEGEANSFTDSKQRLIYVDHSGLYIVEKDKNAVEDIFKNYIPNGKFGFNGEIIKISAIDGKREVSGFDENKKAVFALNCFSTSPVSFKIDFTHFMEQIKKISRIELTSPPPSEQAALKRMAEILNVPAELLVFKGGQVRLVGQVLIPHSSGGFPGFGYSFSGSTDSDFISMSNPLADRLEKIIPLDGGGNTFYGSSVKVDRKVIEEMQNYKFDRSPEAQQRRKEIALKPWDK